MPWNTLVTEYTQGRLEFLAVAEARAGAGINRFRNPAVVTEGGFHADIAGAVNSLGKTVNANRFFLEFRGQAVQAAADIQNLSGRDSPLDQPVTAKIRTVNQNGYVR